MWSSHKSVPVPGKQTFTLRKYFLETLDISVDILPLNQIKDLAGISFSHI